jgi:hypothetical protein
LRKPPAGEHAQSLLRSSSELLEDLDELVGFVAVSAGEVEQLPRSLDDGAAIGRAGNGYPAAAPKLEQAFVSELPGTLYASVEISHTYKSKRGGLRRNPSTTLDYPQRAANCPRWRRAGTGVALGAERRIMKRNTLTSVVAGAAGLMLFVPGFVLTAPGWLFVAGDRTLRRLHRSTAH